MSPVRLTKRGRILLVLLLLLACFLLGIATAGWNVCYAPDGALTGYCRS